MNSFLFSAITICLAAQCALAQYQNSGYQQRKMAPSPQQYGGQQMASYNEQAEYNRAPSSASMSQYEDRAQAASYQAKPAYSAPKSGYQAAPAYAAPAAYAKPAPKYEEPYHAPMPFAWGYDINDGYGGAQYHKETGDDYGKRTGSYGYTDAYGVYRQVDYVADEHGFRATIKTNEPGTANESPADVELHAYEPPSNYYAGNKDNSYNSYAGQQSSSYAAAAAAAKPASYSAGPAAASYSAPRAPQRSSYSAGSRQAAYQQPARSMSAYEPAAQYSSLVPVYQKAGKPLAAAPAAKRY